MSGEEGITDKKKKQIHRAIKKFEKEQDIYAPHYLGTTEHQSSMDGKETETKSFKLRVITGIPGNYHLGGHVTYDVYDKKEGLRYKVRHYFPNVHFDNTYAWGIEIFSPEETDET